MIITVDNHEILLIIKLCQTQKHLGLKQHTTKCKNDCLAIKKIAIQNRDAPSSQVLPHH